MGSGTHELSGAVRPGSGGAGGRGAVRATDAGSRLRYSDRLALGQLGAGRLEDVRVIYRQQPKVRGANHFGSRLVFARDGTLFVTQGERFKPRQNIVYSGADIGRPPCFR
jgi:T5SS/PEP-CTERM-associated repeat protein